MISKKVVTELAQERIDELDKGLYIVELTIQDNNFINLLIDCKEGHVAVSDCISVSRNVEHNLDREVEDFQLSVSSAGMDQAFKVHDQYIKNVGREVKVVYNEHGSQVGKMIEVTDKQITLQTETKEKIEGKKKKETVVTNYEIPFTDIKHTKLVISF